MLVIRSFGQRPLNLDKSDFEQTAYASEEHDVALKLDTIFSIEEYNQAVHGEEIAEEGYEKCTIIFTTEGNFYTEQPFDEVLESYKRNFLIFKYMEK